MQTGVVVHLQVGGTRGVMCVVELSRGHSGVERHVRRDELLNATADNADVA